MDNSLEVFATKLLELKGVTGVPDDVMVELKNQLIMRAENLINASILEHMPKEALDDFEKVLEAGDDAAIQAFCKSNIPNLEEVVAGALMRFQEVYLGASALKQ